LGTYPRYITPGLETFDPIQLARETEEIVSKGDARKYTDFYATGVYGGIATGYTCGCCLIAAPPPPAPRPIVTAVRKRKNATLAAVLSFLLAGLGHFYLLKVWARFRSLMCGEGEVCY